ncbi:putative fatty acid elongation protein [Trichinella spiralis]|uniref:Elongation of very long chain fatty acids protein n=1 Tax=Trichinella spiralis TaxID=6334 RepID=A0ABR3KPM6_TRISP
MPTALLNDGFYAPEIMDELNYTMMFPFERNFDPVPSTVWMQTYWAHSITVSIFYAFAIHQGVKWMEKRPALALDGPLVVWNALLALFSIFGFLRMTPEFFYSLFYGGFEYSVCNSSYAKGVTGFWTEMFALSKLFELGDTAFIVLRKRPLIFLHWYHHITVLVYTWHAYKDHTAAGRWFVWMNYLVHSFMYTYYMARAMRFRPVKWIPMGITILQITQMVIGCFVAITATWLNKMGNLVSKLLAICCHVNQADEADCRASSMLPLFCTNFHFIISPLNSTVDTVIMLFITSAFVIFMATDGVTLIF